MIRLTPRITTTALTEIHPNAWMVSRSGAKASWTGKSNARHCSRISNRIGRHVRKNADDPWATHFHPSGRTYYSHGLDDKFRVITDDKGAHLPLLVSWAKRFHQHAVHTGVLDESDAAVDLYLALEEKDAVPYYYMVNVPFGQLFWFDRKCQLWIQPGDSLGA